ncbi:momilactone A synthase-like [Selaginella moellendorffii]|uniref:momilactone A synthase-like n=1 Tax=Selaginella moellendorffii TaxID=88036 RepID=UPI000D1C4ADB|nr:momilactone A synthase-like [Selaginella moellendorffii]|eukprot:XP_024522025.1 momilactone A synthase-like [Selaginella moellendorffii]
MLSRIQGKVALITGGASGIGAATVKKFRAHGAEVIIADVQDSRGKALAAETGAHYTHCDVSQESQVAAAVDLAVSKFGSLGIMFNNAGIISGPKPADSIARLDMSDLDAVLAVNVRGVAHGVKHAARVMVPRNSGSIISTASVAHIISGSALHPYTISKHAVVGITKSAASELAFHGVRVNCISPAGVVTEIVTKFWENLVPVAEAKLGTQAAFAGKPGFDLRRALMEPEEIAEAALFLASDESRFVSGHDLVVDGSLTGTAAFNIFKDIQHGQLRLVTKN